MPHVILIPAGDYFIGNDLIPSAGPRHRRRLDAPVWIDLRPVTWAHFEAFVAGGGFSGVSFSSEGATDNIQPPFSVDRRCHELVEQTARFDSGTVPLNSGLLERSVTGLSWFESVAVAGFYGARLPYEFEWEVAHTVRSLKLVDLDHGAKLREQELQAGIEHFPGNLREWTLDRFSRVYFRRDYEIRGVRWSPEAGEAGVVVRGTTPDDLYQHVSHRMMALPNVGHPLRGFRRVWDTEPKLDQVLPTWRG